MRTRFYPEATPATYQVNANHRNRAILERLINLTMAFEQFAGARFHTSDLKKSPSTKKHHRRLRFTSARIPFNESNQQHRAYGLFMLGRARVRRTDP